MLGNISELKGFVLYVTNEPNCCPAGDSGSVAVPMQHRANYRQLHMAGTRGVARRHASSIKVQRRAVDSRLSRRVC